MRLQPQSRSSGAAGKGGKLAGRIRYASHLDAKPRERGILPPAASGAGEAGLCPAGAGAGEGRE
jgi:hypothetical protein